MSPARRTTVGQTQKHSASGRLSVPVLAQKGQPAAQGPQGISGGAPEDFGPPACPQAQAFAATVSGG
jgi:hypothetical protein